MRISKRSQQKFADLAAGHGTLAKIREVFEAEDFRADSRTEIGPDSQRRTQVYAFHVLINLEQQDHQQRLLRVYLSALDDWGQDWRNEGLVPEAQALIKCLQRDGAPIDAEGDPMPLKVIASDLSFDRFGHLADTSVLSENIRLIERDLADSPSLAISHSKELVESTCKFVLDFYESEYGNNETLPGLYKKASAALNINRDAVPDSHRGSEAATKILQNLATTVQAMAELRNSIGRGHGKTALSPALERHGRLSFNAARTVVEFMLETWNEREQGAKAARSSLQAVR